TVNQVGQVVSYSLAGGVKVESAPAMSQEQQKLILDVFTQKFALSDPNPKTTTAQSSTVTPDLGPVKVTIVAAPTEEKTPTSTSNSNKPATTNQTVATDGSHHIPGPPTVAAFGGALSERDGLTDSDAT